MTAPAIGRDSCEIAASRHLQPYQQSHLDSLCVLIAAINAIRLVRFHHEPLNRRACRDLMHIGAQYLHRKVNLVDAIRDGIGPRRRRALLRHLVRHAQVDGFQIIIERPDLTRVKTMDDIWRWMAESFAEDCPVLLLLDGTLDHATVATGLTPARLKLFDSEGLSFIRRSSCGIKTGYHLIDPAGLMRLRLQHRA